MNMAVTDPVASQKTRAQVLREKVVVRMALDEMGPAIEAILKANGVELGCSWDKVFPHWLIATLDDDVIACCQIMPSKPVGYVELLYADPKFKFKLRAIALRKLIVQSMATLSVYGCHYVAGSIGEKNHKFANVLENLNFVKIQAASVYVKRLKESAS